MTTLSNRLIEFAFGLGVVLLAHSADGGFIPASFEGDGTGFALVSQVRAPAAGEQATNPDDRHSPLLTDLVVAALPWETPSTGAGSSASSSITVVSGFAVTECPVCTSERIMTYLAEQPDLKVLVPFLDGVFRPPRFVGCSFVNAS